jgi:bifunctional non-homologous end joining protein LigD
MCNPSNLDNTGEFVVQKHTKAAHVHWDLMFQAGNVLQTYRLELPPEKLARQTNTAIKIFDHPLKFLTYEGSVNNNTGNVQIADKGTYQLLVKNDQTWQLLLNGKILKGNFTLKYVAGDCWEFLSA